MIKRILLNQAATFDIFWRAVLGGDDSDRGAAGSRCGFQLENVETFQQLETEAERVRSMAVTLLDLRQREASIEDALSMGEQSTMLFIFTTVTVLFAPLSFVCGLLAMPITGFPDIWSAFPLAEVFGLATLGTVGLCLLMWALYKVYQTMEIAQRNKERQPQAPPQPATVLTRTGDHAGPGTYIWRIPGPWRRGDPLRFRKSRVKQYDNALERVKAAAVGTVRDDSSGHRRSDVEKGAVGVSG